MNFNFFSNLRLRATPASASNNRSCVCFRDWASDEALNDCVRLCSKPLENQQNFAVVLYSKFSDLVQTKLESECMQKAFGAESETCVRQVHKDVREKDLPHLKDSFQRYLDF